MKNEISINKESRLSIIWDITKQCPWNCSICCMSAENGKSARKGELTLEEKLQTVRSIADYSQTVRPVRVDISGGELFTNFEENFLVVQEASRLLGRENVGLSISGFGVTDERAKRLSDVVHDCEMTMDTLPGVPYALRPDGYPKAAAAAVPLLKKYGIEVGVQTVLTISNTNEQNLRDLYRYLCELGVDNWSFIPFYPSGRGAQYPEQSLSFEEQLRAVRFVRELTAGNPGSGPKVDFHYTMPESGKDITCRCVRKSVGILYDGTVVSCFWGVDGGGEPLPKFLLGSMKTQEFSEILRGPKAKYWAACPHGCELDGAQPDDVA